MNPLVLTLDLGTQSLRAVLVNTQGDIVHIVQIKYDSPYFSEQPGYAEQHASFYWDNICKATTQLKEIAGDQWNNIKGVSLTAIRDTLVCMDKEGEAIRPIILWLDKRECPREDPIPLWNKIAFSVVGMLSTIKFVKRISHCNWIAQVEPENWANTYKYMMLSGYLNHKLCNVFRDSASNVVGHIPINNKKSRWQTPRNLVHCAFPVPKDKLYDLCHPGDTIGTITAEASLQSGIPEGLPLIATGSDKGCETIGLSCNNPTKAALSFGTTATVQYTTENYVEPKLFFPPYISAYKGKYNPEFQVYRGYWLISWFKKEFAEKETKEALKKGLIPEELLNQRLKEISPGCNGLIFQPYFTPGVSMPTAKGAVIGFSDVHTRIHIYRAIIEGINFALIDGMKVLEKRIGVQTKEIYVAGGGSRSSEICQITADMFGLPVHRIQTHEAATIGSSLIAFTALGYFPSIEEATNAMVHISDTFIPDYDNHKVYVKIYKDIFRKIFRKLRPLYSVSKHMNL